MELKEFKGRLERQGVSWELFCERAGPTFRASRDDDFYSLVSTAFNWWYTDEKYDFWDEVASEITVEPKKGSAMTTEEFFKFFEETTARMVKISRAKNSDYTGAADNDPFANFTRVESIGICSTETGFLTRMTDKLCRIASFVKQGSLQVKDESVQDTLLDLANYSILMLAYLESQKGNK